MGLVVELLGVVELEAIGHRLLVLDAHEVVVPRPLVRNHVEPEEAVREQHLHLLVVRRRVPLRVGALVLVLAAPLVAGGGELVGGQRARTRRERARDQDRLLDVPGLVGLEDGGVLGHVLRRELRELVGLRVHPAQRLQVLEVLVVRQLVRQRRALVVAELRGHDDAADLLDRGVVGGAHAVEVAGDLRAQVRHADELLEHVLRKHVGEAAVARVVRRDVDVVGAKVQVRGRDGAHAPVCARAEHLLLVRRRRRHDDLVAVHVGRAGRRGRQLRRLLALRLDLRDLLALHARRRDLRAQDDVADLRLRERGHVDVVLLSVVGQDEVLERHLHAAPLVVRERRPDVVGLRDGRLVRLEDHLGAVVVDVERAEDEDEAREGRVARDGAQPVVVEVEQEHLRLRRLQDDVAELLDLERGLERQLQVAALDDDVREVEQMHLQRVEHALARHDDLLRLLLDGQRPDQRRHLLGRLPLGQLSEALLSRPHRRVDDLEEELSGPRVEDEDGAVDGLRRQVALERLVNRHAVHVGVVDKPDDLVREQLAVVLRAEVRLRRLRGVELQALADALAQHVERGVRLEDLLHRLVQQRLHAREPVAERREQVVRQVDGNQRARRRGVDRHVVRGVVEELGARVALDVVRVEVAPAQLHVDPVLVGAAGVELVVGVGEERGLGNGPLVGGEEQHVRARRVHLVALARVDRFLLHRLDLQRVQLLVQHLAQIHHHALVDLLPQMRAEDLDQRDLERRDLAVHEDARQVELHLEPDVDVGAVDRRRPPQREATVGDLVQTGALRVRELLVLHALLEARGLLPEQTLPGREVGALEERVLQDALHAAQRLDHVGAVVVEVPQLAVVALVRPPEGVRLHQLVLLPVGAQAPALVVGQRVAVLLEQRVDARDAPVPRVLQILERQPAVLCVRLLPLQRILGPHALRVEELALPRLDVAVQVGDHLVLVVAEAGAEVRDAAVGLLREAEVRLRDQHVAHREHAEPAELLGRVEHHRREPRGHLGVEPDLDARLDLVLALDEQVEQLRGVDHRLAEVGHQADHRRVPLVGDLGEGRRARGHEDLADAVLELLLRLLVDAQVRLRRALLGGLVLEVPDAVAVREVLVEHAALGQDAHLKPAHVEEQVGVILGVDRHEAVLPLHRRHRPRQLVLDVPEHRAAQVDVVLHQAHARVARPALLVVVPDYVLVVGIRVLAQEALDQVLLLLVREAEHDVHALDVAAVEPDRVLDLGCDRVEGEEVVGLHRRAREL
mmetsp:Transcript_51851/g.121766  ORF Transcript_51851/g.121766 Transcript_51851/m.121766 type:complete len:1251 (+) Transcript_51851:175-3927(+)